MKFCPASISGDYIIITATKEGDATVTVKDGMGMEGSFTVHTTISTSPYTKQELESIKNNSQVRYEFEGYKPYLSQCYAFIIRWRMECISMDGVLIVNIC